MSPDYEANITFSWKQFWISLIYESLPPVFLSPLAALIIERSPQKAWNVCQNRNLLIVSSHNNPLYFIFMAGYVSKLMVDKCGHDDCTFSGHKLIGRY